MFPNYIAYNFLFAEPWYPIFALTVPILLWQIARFFFKSKVVYIPPLILLISPWFWYEAGAKSPYMLGLFLILVVVFLFLLFRNKNGKLASSILVASCVVFLILIFRSSPKILSDPGLVNTVNRYQGVASKVGLKNAGRIAENKYLFYGEYLLVKYLNQFTPVTLFTPQHKLLGFSFSPPLLLGFAIPFYYGLYKLIFKRKFRKYFLASTILVIPSVLSNNYVALDRLILFLPMIIFITTYGLTHLKRYVLIASIVLIIFQFLFILFDIRNKEWLRFDRYSGINNELIKK